MARGSRSMRKWFRGDTSEIIYSGGMPVFPGFVKTAKVFYLDPDDSRATDSNNPGTDPDRPLSSLDIAYGKLTTNSHDTILANARSSHGITSMITWAKNRCHLVFMDGAPRLQTQGGKVSLTGSAGVTNVAALKVTGTRNTFHNMKLMNEHTVSESLYALADVGEGNYYENCAIHNLAAQHLTDAGAASLLLAGDGSTFRECDIGADTVKVTVASGHTILVDKILGGQAKRCLFDRCTVNNYTSQATYNALKVDAEGDLDRWLLFRECDFINFNNSTGSVITDAIEVPGSHDGGFILLDRCAFFGFTNVALSPKNSQVLIQASVPTAATSGLAVTAA